MKAEYNELKNYEIKGNFHEDSDFFDAVIEMVKSGSGSVGERVEMIKKYDKAMGVESPDLRDEDMITDFLASLDESKLDERLNEAMGKTTDSVPQMILNSLYDVSENINPTTKPGDKLTIEHVAWGKVNVVVSKIAGDMVYWKEPIRNLMGGVKRKSVDENIFGGDTTELAITLPPNMVDDIKEKIKKIDPKVRFSIFVPVARSQSGLIIKTHNPEDVEKFIKDTGLRTVKTKNLDVAPSPMAASNNDYPKSVRKSNESKAEIAPDDELKDMGFDDDQIAYLKKAVDLVNSGKAKDADDIETELGFGVVDNAVLVDTFEDKIYEENLKFDNFHDFIDWFDQNDTIDAADQTDEFLEQGIKSEDIKDFIDILKKEEEQGELSVTDNTYQKILYVYMNLDEGLFSSGKDEVAVSIPKGQDDDFKKKVKDIDPKASFSTFIPITKANVGVIVKTEKPEEITKLARDNRFGVKSTKNLGIAPSPMAASLKENAPESLEKLKAMDISGLKQLAVDLELYQSQSDINQDEEELIEILGRELGFVNENNNSTFKFPKGFDYYAFTEWLNGQSFEDGVDYDITKDNITILNPDISDPVSMYIAGGGRANEELSPDEESVITDWQSLVDGDYSKQEAFTEIMNTYDEESLTTNVVNKLKKLVSGVSESFDAGDLNIEDMAYRLSQMSGGEPNDRVIYALENKDIDELIKITGKTKEEILEVCPELKEKINEKLSWPKYLKDLGYDAGKFKKLDQNAHDKFMEWYKESADASEFEQNYLEDLEREITKIPIGENKYKSGKTYEEMSQQEREIAKGYGIDIQDSEFDGKPIQRWEMIDAKKERFGNWETAMEWIKDKWKRDEDLYDFFYNNLGQSDDLVIGNQEFAGIDVQDHMDLGEFDFVNESVDTSGLIRIGSVFKDYKESWDNNEMNAAMAKVKNGKWIDVYTGSDDDAMILTNNAEVAKLAKNNELMSGVITFIVMSDEAYYDPSKKDFAIVYDDKLIYYDDGNGQDALYETLREGINCDEGKPYHFQNQITGAQIDQTLADDEAAAKYAERLGAKWALKEGFDDRNLMTDSEYIQNNLKTYIEDLKDENPNYAEVLQWVVDRLNQSYPGNQDVTPEQIADLLNDTRIKDKVALVDLNMDDMVADIMHENKKINENSKQFKANTSSDYENWDEKNPEYQALKYLESEGKISIKDINAEPIIIKFNDGQTHEFFPGENDLTDVDMVTDAFSDNGITITTDMELDVKVLFEEKINERDYDEETRKEFADKGWALADGSFPIADEEDFDNAVNLAHKAKDIKAAQTHIKKRAKELGIENKIPETWESINEDDGGEKLADLIKKFDGEQNMPGNEADLDDWLTNINPTLANALEYGGINDVKNLISVDLETAESDELDAYVDMAKQKGIKIKPNEAGEVTLWEFEEDGKTIYFYQGGLVDGFIMRTDQSISEDNEEKTAKESYNTIMYELLNNGGMNMQDHLDTYKKHAQVVADYVEKNNIQLSDDAKRLVYPLLKNSIPGKKWYTDDKLTDEWDAIFKNVNEEDVDDEKFNKYRPEVEKFLAENPEPSDDEVHAFAMELGIEKDDVEEIFYKIAGESVNEGFGTYAYVMDFTYPEKIKQVILDAIEMNFNPEQTELLAVQDEIGGLSINIDTGEIDPNEASQEMADLIGVDQSQFIQVLGAALAENEGVLESLGVNEEELDAGEIAEILTVTNQEELEIGTDQITPEIVKEFNSRWDELKKKFPDYSPFETKDEGEALDMNVDITNDTIKKLK